MALGVQDAMLVVFTFLQIAAAMLLWNASAMRPAARHLLAIFFVVNAGNTGILWVLDAVGGGVQAQSGWGSELRNQLDAYAVWPLIGFLVAAVGTHKRTPRLAWALALFGLPFFLIHIPIQLSNGFDDFARLGLREWIWSWYPHQEGIYVYERQAILFYYVVAAAIIVLGRRRDIYAWVALALVPRMMFWPSTTTIAFIGGGYEAIDNGYSRAALGAAAFAIVGIVLLLRNNHVPQGLVVASIFIGPLIAFAEYSDNIRSSRIWDEGLNLIINLTTMALFRPLLAVAGLHHRAAGHILAHSLAATAVAIPTALLFLGPLSTMSAKWTAVAVGLFALGFLEARNPLHLRIERPTRLRPGEKIGSWRIARLLGQSPDAEVYLAGQGRGKSQREAALKLPRSNLVDGGAWQAEADALFALEHPHVVRLHEFLHTPKGPCLVMEHVAGVSLQERLQSGPLGTSELQQLAKDLMSAVDALHQAGIVHQDIKPSNIMLTPAGAKLLDFGIARKPDKDATINASTGLPVPHGTPAYMSPEQARGERVDARSDLYSLAAVLHEARTGEPVVPQKMPAGQILFAVASLGSPPVVKGPWRDWTAKALAPKLNARFPSARAMSQAWPAGQQI